MCDEIFVHASEEIESDNGEFTGMLGKAAIGLAMIRH
jgi:hypothetical protein